MTRLRRSRGPSRSKNVPALSNLATAYIFQKQYDEAIPLLEKAVQLLPKYDTLWGNLGDAYVLARRPADVLAALPESASSFAEAQLHVNPNNTSALAQAAKYSAKLHDNTKARALIARAVAANPGDGDVLFKSALIYEWTGDRAKAIDAVEAAWKRGYSLEQIRKEPELETLRQDPRFQAWIQTSSR